MTRVHESGTGWVEFWKEASRNLNRGWSWSGFERSAFFINRGAADFVDIAPVLGADQVSDGRGLAAGDIDGDGDLDLVGVCSGTHPHTYVLRNDLATDRHFLLVDLVPRDRLSSAGSRLLATAGGRTVRRDVALGQGFVAQHARSAHFGLGAADKVETLEIRWPDGELQTLTDLAVDQRIRVRQGVAQPEKIALRPRNYNATRKLAPIEWDSYAGALTLVEGAPPDLSDLELTDLEGNVHALAVGAEGLQPDGPAILLNLWATWCANCKAEMPDLNEAHTEGKAGLRVIGISLDDEASGEEVRATAEDWGIDFPVVHLTGKDLEVFQRRLERLMTREGWTMPTSLLLGPRGRVLVLARGRVDLESLTLFLETLRSERE